MKKFIKKIIHSLGFELARHYKKEFDIIGMKFLVDPCSVGCTPQGELTGKGAIRLINERELKKLKILDICCGVGLVGLTIYQGLKNEKDVIKELVLADINIFNINSINKTLPYNQMNHLIGDTIRVYLSDGLKGIPTSEKFDIIVSNPPHYFEKSFDNSEVQLTPTRLGTNDAGWNFHKSFYEIAHNYLTDKGEIWLLENGYAAKEKDLLPFIEANAKLKYVKKIKEPLINNFFWMVTRKV